MFVPVDILLEGEIYGQHIEMHGPTVSASLPRDRCPYCHDTTCFCECDDAITSVEDASRSDLEMILNEARVRIGSNSFLSGIEAMMLELSQMDSVPANSVMDAAKNVLMRAGYYGKWTGD